MVPVQGGMDKSQTRKTISSLESMVVCNSYIAELCM